MEQLNPVLVIHEARGFLNALRELCVPPAVAWIAILPVSEGVECAIDDYASSDDKDSELGLVYRSRRQISGKEVRKFIRNNLFERIPATEEQRTQLEWHLNEYFDRAADADAGEISFGRLWRQDSVFIDVKSSEFDLHGAIAFVLKNYVIVLTLGIATKAPSHIAKET